MSLYNDEGKWIGKPSAAPGALYNPAYDKKKKKKEETDESTSNDKLKIESKESSGKTDWNKYDSQYEDHFKKTKKAIKKAKAYKPKEMKFNKKYNTPLTSKNLPKKPKLKKPSLGIMEDKLNSKKVKNPSGLKGKSVEYNAKSKGKNYLESVYSSAPLTGVNDLKKFKKSTKKKLKGTK